MAELGEPFGQLWRLLVDAHGPREAARTFARVLGVVEEHGETAVTQAITAALATRRTDLLALAQHLMHSPPRPQVTVPASLAGYEIEAPAATTYDALWRREVDHE